MSRRMKREEKEALLLALLAEGPKNMRDLNLNTKLSESSVSRGITGMMRDKPRKVYICAWTFTYPNAWTPVYAAGDCEDVVRTEDDKEPPSYKEAMKQRVVDALQQRPMSNVELAAHMGTSHKTVIKYVFMLRQEPRQVRVAKYVPPPGVGRWIPVYGLVEGDQVEDAPEPSRAEIHAYRRAMEDLPPPPAPVIVFSKQTWCSALGVC